MAPTLRTQVPHRRGRCGSGYGNRSDHHVLTNQLLLQIERGLWAQLSCHLSLIRDSVRLRSFDLLAVAGAADARVNGCLTACVLESY